MRTAKINRKTKETDISCEINIDGTNFLIPRANLEMVEMDE